MVDIIKQDMTDIWAIGGDIQAPDSAKIRAGWAVEVVPRQWWNWFENRQDSNIAYLLQKGIPEWDATTEFLANRSYVQRNGIVYKAASTTTGVDPATATSAQWIRAFSDYSVANSLIGELTPTAGGVPYFISPTEAGQFASTAYGRGLAGVNDAAAARAYISAQLANSNLTALSGVSAATNVLPYFTSGTAMSGTTLTAFGRSLLDDVDAAAGRATLELNNVDNTSDANKPVSTATQTALNGKQNLNNNLTALSGLIGTAGAFPYFTAAGAMANTPSTAYGRGLLNTANADSAQNYLGVTAVGKSVFNATNSSMARAALELGTAATSDVATTQTDTTAGRLTRVGDWGLGQQNAIPMPDMTVAWNGGFYLVPPNAPGLPADIASVGGVFIAIRSNFGILIQTTATIDRRMYHGSRSGTTGAVTWKEVLNVGDYGLGDIGMGAATEPQVWRGNRFARWDTTAADSPGGYNVGLDMGYSSNRRMQIAINTGGLMHWRYTDTAETNNAWRIALARGDLGIGGPIAASNQNLNTMLTAGNYWTPVQTQNGPFAAGTSNAQGYLEVIQHVTTGYLIQRFTSINAPTSTWMRRQGAGVWSNWELQFTQSTIVGTVNQAAGIPTGAVIQYVNNANGEAIKYADGTLICWFKRNVSTTCSAGQYGQLFYSPYIILTYPVPFVGDLPVVSPSCVYAGIENGVGSLGLATSQQGSLTNCTFMIQGGLANSGGRLGYMAIGRWY